MKISEILDSAADKIAAPGTWAQGAEAFDETGHIVDPRTPGACKRCWKGAMIASDPDHHTAVGNALFFANMMLPSYLAKEGYGDRPLGVWVTSFNDHPGTSQEMVVAVSRGLADLARTLGR